MSPRKYGFLTIASDIVDYAKFTDHPGYLYGYTSELIEKGEVL